MVGSEPRLADCPGSGFGRLVDPLPADRVTVTERSMDNGRIAMTWNLDGQINSLIDVQRSRQLLATGRVIALELAPDHPVEYDAWDLESWTQTLGLPVNDADSVELRASKALLAQLVVRRHFGRSTLTEMYTMRAGSPRLDITFDIDWREDEHLLSLVVPVDVHAREASCDIQFGLVKRPTHSSTSWDAAKFEVCAHRFVDLSEPSFGVAVLNDGRYGHHLQHGGVRVSLLRAPKYPDPTADHGHHTMTISVMPHGPGLLDVLAEAEALNMPLRVVTGTAASSPEPIVTIDQRGVQITAIKRAEDGSGDLIVRLYEACGDRTTVTVHTPFHIGSASRCNLFEEPQHGFECSDGIVAVTLRPFELVTLRLAPRST
jgi:alpha-mannosidase